MTEQLEYLLQEWHLGIANDGFDEAQAKAKATATDFEAMFLNSMFAQMTSGIKGEGPFGDTPGTGVWRSMLTEQYSKSFAKAGGVGISNEVYRTLILQQAGRAS